MAGRVVREVNISNVLCTAAVSLFDTVVIGFFFFFKIFQEGVKVRSKQNGKQMHLVDFQ